VIPPLHFGQSIDRHDPTPRRKLFRKGSFYEESPHCPCYRLLFVLMTPCFAHHMAVVVVNKNNKDAKPS